jgi:hypothetical protein
MNCSPACRNSSIVGLLAFAYFAIFPDDLATLLMPVRELFGLTQALSPWFYVLASVLVVAWAARSIWLPRRPRSVSRSSGVL